MENGKIIDGNMNMDYMIGSNYMTSVLCMEENDYIK